MSNIDKHALCVPERKKHDWGKAIMHTCDFCDHYAMTITTEDGEHSCANCCDAEYVGVLTCALEMAIERAEAAEKRIAELSESHSKLREAMAGIHNTITGGGAYTPLASILNASKRAYEESDAAAGKGG